MARIIGIDFGTKKTGLAVTDPLQIIASPLATIPTPEVLVYIDEYLKREDVALVLIGVPQYEDQTEENPLVAKIRAFKKKLVKIVGEKIPIYEVNENLTSEEAKAIILQSGTPKKKRRDKTLVDKVSASLIISRYMEEQGIW